MANTGLILSLLLSCILLFTNGAVTHLDSQNFDSFVRSHRVVLVDFFAPWCGHCIKMAPAYEEASAQLHMVAPEIALAKTDCDGSGKMVCQRLGVNAFPTLLLFRNGMRVQGEYEGERSADGLVKFMMGQRGSPDMMFRDAQSNQPLQPPQPVQPVQATQPQFMPQQQPIQVVKPQFTPPRPKPNLPNAVNLLNTQNAAMQHPAIKPSNYPATIQRLTPDIVSRIIGLINAGKIHAKHHIPRVTDSHFKVTLELANKVLAMMSSGELSPKNTIPKTDGDDEDKKKPAQASAHEVAASPDFIKQLQNMINAAKKKTAKGKGKAVKISIGPKGVKVDTTR